MFNFPRKVVYSHSLKHLARNFRGIASNRTSEPLPGLYHNTTSSKDTAQSNGYGEKEIFLLPTDSRTPLPGNTGLAPLYLLSNEIRYPLPEFAGERCEVLSSDLSADRHLKILSQFSSITTEPEVSSYHKAIPSEEILECVAHECPQLLKTDFSDLFPKIDLFQDNLTVLTLCQKTENDMSQWNEAVEQEREHLEGHFVVAAQAICNTLRECGYWADFIHPSIGKPFLTPTTKATMLETDLRYRHFGFTIEDLGCCKIISHHLWGTHAFVGAIFTNASIESSEMKDILGKYSNTC